MRIINIITLLLTLLMLPCISVSQDLDGRVRRSVLTKDNTRTDDIETQGLVISAGRSTKSVDKLPVTVYVISHDEIVANGWVTLCDVLKRAPGIRVSQPQSGEFGEAFVQRGLTGNIYTKILLNGVDIKPSGPEGMPLGANIPIRQAERIEIIYGPASASYGNDACSGVINIVTSHKSDKNYASADLIMGDGGYSYANFSSGGKVGHGNHVVDLSVYGSMQRYDNMPIDHGSKAYNPWYYYSQSTENGEAFVLPDGSLLMPGDVTEDFVQALRQQSVLVDQFMSHYHGTATEATLADIPQQGSQLGIEMMCKGLRLTYNMFQRRDFSCMGQSPLLFSYNNSNSYVGEVVHRITLGGTWTIGRLSTSTNIMLNHYRMDKGSSYICAWSDYPQYQWGASDDITFNQDFAFKCSDKISLYAGLNTQTSGVLPATCVSDYKFGFDSYKWFAESVDYSDPLIGKFGINPYRYSKHALYFQGDFDFLRDRLSLTVGARLDHNSLYGMVMNPRIALLGKISDRLTIRASRGYSYKEPSAENLYYCLGIFSQEVQHINYEHVENPDLNPERIQASELGARYIIDPENQKFSSVEFIMYTTKISEQLTRTWVPLNTETHPGGGAFKDRSLTRTYLNEENGEVQQHSMQLNVVLRDIVPSIGLNIMTSVNYNLGHEILAADGVSQQKDDYIRLNYVRMVPKWFAQFSYDFMFLKRISLRIDNVWSARFARKYFQGNDNEYFWYPKYYDLDATINIKLSERLHLMMMCYNVLNRKFGGIDNKRMDSDLPYNPQMLRRFRFGLSYNF